MTSPFEIPFDGAVIRGEADGFGIPVVFLHSGVTDRRMWGEQMQMLAEEGYHVISYDRRGYGETTTEDVPFNHLIDLEAVLDRLSVHAAILVGASMGGGLAIDFALEHPERTIALVLMGTAVTGAEGYEVDEEVEQLEEAFEYARERGNIGTANRIEAHLWLDGPYGEAGRVTGDARQLFLAMNEIHLNHPELTQEERPESAMDNVHTINAPTLLVVGELDCSDIIALHEDLSEEIENSFAVVIEDTAHFPSLERPDLFNPILGEFLEAVTGHGEDEDEGDGDDGE
ncbi:MAG: alpha/beta hydrolase [Devosia sp.]|uniref:alpha/beta fold hydrolase n=1 Tax=Devosia sp. TaxID=1871048 RepID=UPI001ACB8007|nr:alpha/beta hydrolase [Devosia sp.]MBN9309893.1 alpha/beta hydrolase [Devosia sp.]MBN9316545.1 alpha/beta hydrolase [Devosia sp.]